MVDIEGVWDALGHRPCRRCINKRFNVNLQPGDCKYFPYEDRCSNCGTQGGIVGGFTISGRLKMLPKRSQ